MALLHHGDAGHTRATLYHILFVAGTCRKTSDDDAELHADSDNPIELYEVSSNTEMAKEWPAKPRQVAFQARNEAFADLGEGQFLGQRMRGQQRFDYLSGGP